MSTSKKNLHQSKAPASTCSNKANKALESVLFRLLKIGKLTGRNRAHLEIEIAQIASAFGVHPGDIYAVVKKK